MATLKYKQNGQWHDVLGQGQPYIENTTTSNGVLHMNIATATEQVCGSNWQQKELASVISEPFTKEWGWQCCVHDAEIGDTISTELYLWLYRCLKEGFSVKQRTLIINEIEQEPIIVDGGDNLLTLILGDKINEYTEEQLEYIRNRWYPSNGKDFRIINIPLAQFKGLTAEKLCNIIYRVKEDNPELCFLCHPFVQIPSVITENDQYIMLRSIEPTDKKRKEMISIMRKTRAFIADKIFNLYGILPGSKLTLEQRKKIVKVVHDYIILHGWGSKTEANNGTTEINYLLSSAYAALDPNIIAFCAGYAQAFNYVLRFFGINSIYLSGNGYRYNGTGGGHGWNAVQMTNNSDYEYGMYSDNPNDWTSLDVYWDEPAHETDIGGTPEHNNIIWRYFMNISTIFTAEGQYPKHEILYNKGYGKLPFGNALPRASYPYSGNTIYKWEES